MPTTSNFGWTTPADTDLVKDGALAIRTLGNGIDTSFLDLKGGTTDQVLAKNSNTDLDFKWVAQDDSNAIQNAIVDAKGDLISATAADTPARLAVGANGTVLTADSAEATGLKWAAPASASYTWTTYTPSYTNLTIGNATVVAKYIQIDKFVNVIVHIDFGSTTSVSGQIKVSLPVTAVSNSKAKGFGTFRDDSTTKGAPASGVLDSTTDLTAYPFYVAATGEPPYPIGVSATQPWTWATSDTWSMQITYEAA